MSDESMFISKIIKNEGGFIRLITAIENQKPCWFILKIKPELYSDFRQASKNKFADISRIGEILSYGWGKKPPESIISFIKEKFSY